MDATDEVIGIMDRKQRDMKARIRELEAELAEARRDECRKEFMCQQGCYMWHDIDGESCWLVWPHGRDGEGQMESQTDRYATHNAAIDAAMEGK